MSNTTAVLLERQPAPAPEPNSYGSLLVGGGILILLCGAIASWQKSRRPSGGTGRSSAASGVHPARDQNPLHFTQPLQWLGYGKELEKAKRYQEALKVYDQALEHFPNDFRFWHERGLTLAKLERYREALVSYDQANAIRPNHPDIAHERGDTLLELERFEEAYITLGEYLRYVPGSPHVLADQGYALYRLGRYPEALDLFQQVLKSPRQDPNATRRTYYFGVEVLNRLDQVDDALALAQKAVARYPDESCYREQHERLLRKLDRWR